MEPETYQNLAHSLQLLNGHKFVLASASPRRAQLLELIGMKFEIIVSSVDEKECSEKNPAERVKNLALRKAQDVASDIGRAIVIGADTIVVLDGAILGKPRDAQEASRMLRQLSARTHQVYTGFSLVRGEARVVDYERTSVHFRELSEDEIRAYVNTGGPLDKAGAYGIQDVSAMFVDRIEGCFYNVVGFPLAKCYATLNEFTGAFPQE